LSSILRLIEEPEKLLAVSDWTDSVTREGHGVHHKVTVVGAVEVRPRPPSIEGKKHKRMVYAGRLRLRLVPGRGAKELTEFVQENAANGAVVRTDGWMGYDELTKLGYLVRGPEEPHSS
jgi:ISXO2-like transposase domain